MEAYSFQFRFNPIAPWMDAPEEHVTMDRAAVETVMRRAKRDWDATHEAVLELRVVVLTPTRFEPLKPEEPVP